MSDNIIYVDGAKTKVAKYKAEDGAMKDYPRMGQGPATKATADDLARDALGFTNPNLHRRIEPKSVNQSQYEFQPRQYQLMIQGVNSYKTTTMSVHDENSTTSEIP